MHEKRIATKVEYPLKRKSVGRFVVVPRPGPHPKEFCIPLSIILRDFLHYGESLTEAKKIIKSGKILVDGKVRKDYKYPVGVFDVVEIPETKEIFRIVPSEKKLKLIKIPKGEKNLKICRIDNKTVVKKGKTQLNLNDGKNILSDKKEYKTGDSLIIGLPDLKIKKHLKRKKDSLCLIIRGQNKGKIGKIKNIEKTDGSKPNKIIVHIEKKTVSLPEDFIFVVGDKTPEIKVKE